MVFNVGGQQHSKISIVTSEDLNALYSRYTKGKITLWYDGSSTAIGQQEYSGKCKKRFTCN